VVIGQEHKVHLVGSMNPRVAKQSYLADVVGYPWLKEICENQSYTLGFWLPLWHRLPLVACLEEMSNYVQHLARGNSVRLQLEQLPSKRQLAQLLELVKSYNIGYLYLVSPQLPSP
jgi:hypothetical protein